MSTGYRHFLNPHRRDQCTSSADRRNAPSGRMGIRERFCRTECAHTKILARRRYLHCMEIFSHENHVGLTESRVDSQDAVSITEHRSLGAPARRSCSAASAGKVRRESIRYRVHRRASTSLSSRPRFVLIDAWIPAFSAASSSMKTSVVKTARRQ